MLALKSRSGAHCSHGSTAWVPPGLGDEGGRRRAVLGTPAEAADQLHALAERFDVDEVMVHPVASAHRGTDPATAPGRETTLELLAKELF